MSDNSANQLDDQSMDYESSIDDRSYSCHSYDVTTDEDADSLVAPSYIPDEVDMTEDDELDTSEDVMDMTEDDELDTSEDEAPLIRETVNVEALGSASNPIVVDDDDNLTSVDYVITARPIPIIREYRVIFNICIYALAYVTY
jgi:hypothetical protein